ncbi:glutathione S-transferase family protein [Paraburkholderia bannensis]|uniref:glutathione S-transferase family protein n=1 Tax=Paraburkholderia bannensis TaxID=765414 RepID=UPI002AC34F6F|nr:glutathione S-transferase family protein [Paraburkholderia bannensis]
MIELYAFATPNSVKVTIALEELGIPYSLKAVDLRKAEQKSDWFTALNPNGKVPVIVDDAHESPLGLSESGAILVYLAEKHHGLLPSGGEARARVFEQLYFHASGLGAAFGNAFMSRKAAPEIAAKAVAEAQRTLAVLDGVLASHEYVAGNELTIADIAHFGWIWRHEAVGVDLASVPHVTRWMAALNAREGFARGIAKTIALAS